MTTFVNIETETTLTEVSVKESHVTVEEIAGDMIEVVNEYVEVLIEPQQIIVETAENYKVISIQNRRDWIFEIPFAVPSRGSLYLWNGGTSLSSAPVVVPTDSTVDAISVRVNKPDVLSTYEIEILRNEVVISSLYLDQNTNKAKVSGLNAEVLAGDELQARFVRVSGPPKKSDFRRASVTLELIE